MSSRRHFLKQSSTATLALMLPRIISGETLSLRQRRVLEADITAQRATVLPAGDPDIAALVARAVEAARAGGASYADARFQGSDWERWSRVGVDFGGPLITRDAGLGVRALYNGYWGYAGVSTDTLTPDQAAAAGRAAIAQAKTGARGKGRTVSLAPTPVVTNGTWTTPITIDPFSVSWEEKTDFLNGWIDYVASIPFGGQLLFAMECVCERQTFASSEGATYAQTLYRTGVPQIMIVLPGHWRTRLTGMRSGESLVTRVGMGWEYFKTVPFEEHVTHLLAQARDVQLAEPADVGRYDVVFDGAALAKLADGQLGFSTELDRAMGYLANRDGTSYLNDPLSMLGTFKVGSPLLNVSMNRSTPGGAATVKWDDEGVEPEETSLITNGILTDFQTTRESATWLAEYYQKIGKPVRSHGGAIRGGVGDAPQQGASNLSIAPATDDTSFETLCAGVKKGLAVRSMQQTIPDQQHLHAESTGDVVYEIVDGKLGRTLRGAVFWTRTPEFWRNLMAVGGARTVCGLGLDAQRQASGSPWTSHTVSAPAAAFKQVTVTVNAERRRR